MSVQMQMTTISTRGQIVLPKAVRDIRQWPAGTRLVVEDTPEGVLLRPAAEFPKTDLDQVSGSLRYSGKPLSIEDMDAAVAREARRRARD